MRTPAPSAEKGQALTRMMADDTMVIPVYYVYEMYITAANVHDTGYAEWSEALSTDRKTRGWQVTDRPALGVCRIGEAGEPIHYG